MCVFKIPSVIMNPENRDENFESFMNRPSCSKNVGAYQSDDDDICLIDEVSSNIISQHRSKGKGSISTVRSKGRAQTPKRSYISNEESDEEIEKVNLKDRRPFQPNRLRRLRQYDDSSSDSDESPPRKKERETRADERKESPAALFVSKRHIMRNHERAPRSVSNYSNYPRESFGVVRRQINDMSVIQTVVENIKDFPPCPGLDHVFEIREIGKMSYFCELCNSCCQSKDIVIHLQAYKHQLSCLKYFCPELYGTVLKKPKQKVKEDLNRILRCVEKRKGTGTIVVLQDYPENNRAAEVNGFNYNGRVNSFQDINSNGMMPLNFEEPNAISNSYVFKSSDSEEEIQIDHRKDHKKNFKSSYVEETYVGRLHKMKQTYDASDDEYNFPNHNNRSPGKKYSSEKCHRPRERFVRSPRARFVSDHHHHHTANLPEGESNYPKAPVGILRRKVRDESYIQHIVEKPNFPPCPGLEHIIELRGINETIYYCDICNLRLSKKEMIHHLLSPEHRLQCLKIFCPNRYERLNNVPSYKVDAYICEVLARIQRDEGIGRIVVQQDYDLSESQSGSRTESSHPEFNTPHTSFETPSTSSSSYRHRPRSPTHSPDSSKAHYYCKMCETNMPDFKTWKSHADNSRPLINVKKDPIGVSTNNIPQEQPEAEAFLLERVKNYPEPIVGLDYIYEFQNLEGKKDTYHCLLCGECLDCLKIVPHLETMRHRKNYLNYIDHYTLDHLKKFTENDNKTYYVLEEICRKVQQEFGCGRPKVYVLKTCESTGLSARTSRPSSPTAGPSSQIAGPSSPIASPSPVAGPSSPVAGPSQTISSSLQNSDWDVLL